MDDAALVVRVRRVVSAQLGIAPDALRRGLRLADDLRLDPVALLELVRAVEGTTGIALAEAEIDGLTTVGDLYDLVAARVRAAALPEEPGPRVWLRSVPADGGAITDRHVRLTPYMAEVIAEEACTRGRGARLEAVLPRDASVTAVARVEHLLANARRAGADVVVRRGPAPAPMLERAPRGTANPAALRTLAELSVLVAATLQALQAERELRGVEPEARAAELAMRRAAADRALAAYAAFVTRSETHLPPLVRERAVATVDTLARLSSTRAATPAGPAGDAWTAANEALVGVTEVVAAVTSDADYGRMVKAVLALQRATVAAAGPRPERSASGSVAIGTVLAALRDVEEGLAGLLQRTATGH